MGTMSRFVPKDVRWQEGRSNPRAGLANRVMSGLLIRDVLAIIQNPKWFNRATRKAAFSLWRRHARNVPGMSRHHQPTPGHHCTEEQVAKGRGKFTSKLPTQPSILGALDRYKGVQFTLDHPSQVQKRMLVRVGLM